MFTNAARLMLAKSERNPNFPAMLKDFKAAYQHYVNEFERIPAGAVRAHSIHCAIDKAIEDSRARGEIKNTTCKQGCTACCYQRVGITPDEADLLAYVMEGGEIEIDRDLLARQAAHKGDELDFWNLPREEARCVFLGPTGDCRVYEHRPSACRKYFVRSAPEICAIRSDSANARTVEVNASYDAEVMGSAQLHLAGEEVEPLAVALKKRLERS